MKAEGGKRKAKSAGIPSAFRLPPSAGHDLVQLFVEVDDIDGYLAKAESLGGRTLIPKQQLPDGDALALLIDPAGLSIGLYTPHK